MTGSGFTDFLTAREGDPSPGYVRWLEGVAVLATLGAHGPWRRVAAQLRDATEPVHDALRPCGSMPDLWEWVPWSLLEPAAEAVLTVLENGPASVAEIGVALPGHPVAVLALHALYDARAVAESGGLYRLTNPPAAAGLANLRKGGPIEAAERRQEKPRGDSRPVE